MRQPLVGESRRDRSEKEPCQQPGPPRSPFSQDKKKPRKKRQTLQRAQLPLTGDVVAWVLVSAPEQVHRVPVQKIVDENRRRIEGSVSGNRGEACLCFGPIGED